MKKLIFHPIFILILFVGVFFYRQIFLGETFYCCDNLLINIPARVYLVKEVLSSRFPLWNPLILSGTPFLADINLGLLYPLNVLYFLLPSFVALKASIITSFAVALSGMYLLGKSFKLSDQAAVLGAIVFGFSGTLVTYINNIPLLQVGSLLPWVVWSAHRYVLLPSVKTLLIAVAFASLQIIAGHPQLTYYTWLLLVGLIVWVLTGSDPVKRYGLTLARALLLIAVFGFFVFLLTSVQVLPFLEFVRLSTRAGRGFDYATFDSLHPLNLVRFILPNIVGDLSAGTAWVQGGSVSGYVGVLALVLAFFAPKNRRLVKFLAISAALSLLLAFGKYTAVYYLFYKMIPGLGSFRSPVHLLLLYTFSVTLLACLGLDRILESKKVRQSFTKLLIPVAVLGLLLAVASFGLSQTKIPWHELVFLPEKLATKIANFSEFPQILALTATNALISAVLVLVFVWLLQRKRKLLFLPIFLELFLFARHGILTVPENRVSAWFFQAQNLASDLRAQESARIFISRDLDQAPRVKRFGLPNYDEESAWQVQSLRTNLNLLYNLPTPDGYASMVYRPYALLFAKTPSDPTGVDLRLVSPTTLSFLGVGALAFRDFRDSHNILTTQLPTFGRLFLKINGRQSHEGIADSSFTSNQIKVDLTLTSPADLTLINVNYPGWQAYLDGKRVTIMPLEMIFQGIPIPAGSHQLKLVFWPESVVWGLALSILGLFIFLVLAVSEAVNRKKSKGYLRQIGERLKLR